MYKILFCVSFTVLILSNCGDSDKIRKRDILSKEDFLQILFDIHKADGVITASGINNKNNTDSVSLYNYVLQKHNVSRLQFMKTVQYYSLHSEEYLLLYDSLDAYYARLLADLRVKEQKDDELEKEKLSKMKKKDSLNLWILKDEWLLPQDGKRNPIAFKINTKIHGTYTLKAEVKIFRDDKSIRQRMTIIANYADGSKDLNTVAVNFKDDNFYNYEVSITTNRKKELSSISGWVLDHSKKTENKHSHVKNIDLRISEEQKILKQNK